MLCYCFSVDPNVSNKRPSSAAKNNTKCLGLEDKGFQECMDAAFPSQKNRKCIR